jgi:WD40 repeat protein
MTTPDAFTVRLLTEDGHPVGVGVLVGDRHILTCAHVVNSALGLNANEQPKPDGIVALDFPLLPTTPRAMARIDLWLPPPRPGAAGDDIAGLVLTDTTPPTAQPIRLAVDPARPGTRVRVFGCPRGRPDGKWVEATVQGSVLGSRVQLEARSAERVEQGFSGSPVFDETIGQVVGLISLVPAKVTERDSYAIPAERLRQAWPTVLGTTNRPRDELTILRLRGPRFPSEQDITERPDLIVVTGDLAEHALPSEYRTAVDNLTALAAALGVPRRHVAIVPGAHDVNRKACQAYFAERESREADPVPPYFPKWNEFAAAFCEFYKGASDAAFTPDEPWTLFPMPELGVAVAGLNSTMAMTHRAEDDRGELGAAQLDWFARQANGPLTIAAVYHQDCALPGADLRLHGSTAGHELITIRRPTVNPQPPPSAERDDFFARVVEATRVRHPGATVTERPHEGYLRVTSPRPGGITEQWPVGVLTGPATEDAIREFATGVHAQFASRDPQVPSELVHAGPAADPGLTRLARQRGIRLRSLIEYQGMLDQRALAHAQQERLLTDRIYAEHLYVPQRFRPAGDNNEPRHNLLDQAVDWLAADSAQLLIVLGDFGRGKTAFLRQLARTLPAELPGLLPILVELRALEKAPTLEALLVLHLASQGVPDIDVAKLRYMVRSGRLALLFDGFDELELRVGYDNAADYLRILLASVTGQAKVVMTSRTQHFRSNQQVLDVRVSGSHVVLLEDLSDDQIAEFLTKLYDGDRDRAQARLALIQGIGNLHGLAHNPRMLAFIAALDDARLRAVKGELSAAQLYGEIIDFWLSRETERHAHQRGMPTLSKRERLDACTGLALRLWASKDPTIALGDLSAEVSATLTGLAERGFSDEQASHSIGSGSLLVRTEDGAFAFVHQSVMEWLVAAAAAHDPRHTLILTGRRMSRLMAEFYADLAGHDTARAWTDAILADDQATEVAKQNALLIPGRVEHPVAAVPERRATNLGGVDLRGYDLDSANLYGADLRFADLRGMRLRGTILSGASLYGADLRGARLTSCELYGAVLTGSRWDRAAVLDSLIDLAPELRAAAVHGRDRADAMIAPQPRPYRVAYSPDGTLLAVASYDFIEILDTDGYQSIRVLRPDADQVESIAFSPDGTLLAVAAQTHEALVLDVTTGKIVNRLRGHGDPVNAVAFSPLGTEIATASVDGTARTWHLADGTSVVSPFKARAVRSVAYSADGVRLAIGADDGTAAIWDPPHRLTAIRYNSGVSAVAFSPDGTLLATGQYFGLASLVDAWSGAERATFPSSGGVVDLAFSPDGSLLVGAFIAGGACVWDVTTQQILHKAPGDGTYGVAFTPDGTELAITSPAQLSVLSLANGTTTVVRRSEHRWAQVEFLDGGSVKSKFEGEPFCDWDLAHGTPRRRGGETRSRTAVSRDRSQIALANEGGVSIHNVDRASVMAELRPVHVGVVNDLGFSPDGRLLVTASQDGTFRLWDRSRAVAETTAPGVPGPATAVTFTPDGTHVMIGSGDGGIRDWDISQFTGVRRLVGRLTKPPRPEDRLKAHAGAVHALTFSDDGSLLASGSADGTAMLWTGDLRPVATIRGHLGPVRAVAFSPDNTRLATACEDRTVRIWDITAVTVPRLVMTLLDLPDGGYATLLPDGRYKLHGDPAGHLWWAMKLCRFAPGELDDHVPALTRLPDDAPL